MIHLCFIIENSLTMDQRPNSGMSLLDSVKSSIQNTLRNLNRLGFPNNHEHIHLFCTSNPTTYLSSFQHDQSHLYCQLKSITSSIHTDPALTIQTALEQISKFRILSEAETYKGYREAFIYEPALIIFLSDRMTRRKILNIINSIDQAKFHLRSQYQFAAYLVSIPSYTERNLLTEEAFKSTLEGQKEIKLYGQALRRMNSEFKFIMNYENMNNFILSRIQTFKPSLLFNFQLKEIKKKLNQFVPSERGLAYFKAWEQYLSNIPFQLVPNKLFKIPLPFNIKLNESQGQKRIQSMGKLKFYLDLSKKYVDSNSNILPENKYKILPNSAISMLQNQNLQEKYPIFFEHKGTECPVGLLSVSARGTQINFYFANFTQLNSILKAVEAKQNFKLIEANLYSYLSSIPHFYLKFIKVIFDKLNLNIDYDLFENSTVNPINLSIQSKLQNLRMIEKRNLPKIFQHNLQNHQSYRADCCQTYSSNYNYFSKTNEQPLNNVQTYFSNLIGQLLTFKKKVGIEDYLTTNQMDAVPMVKELQKYNNVKKIGDDDFNQNITVNFGNPYRKKRKVNESQSNPKDAIINDSPNAPSFQNQQKAMEPISFSKEIEKQLKNTYMVVDKSQNTKNPERKYVIISKQTKQNDLKENSSTSSQIATKKDVKQDSMIDQAQKQPEIIDETILRVNSIAVKKQIEINFNPINLATEIMLKNQTTIQRFMQRWKNKS